VPQTDEPIRSQSFDYRRDNEREPLLGQGASDGAHAVRASYGAGDSARPRGSSEPDKMSANEASKLAEQNASPP
jgi:hypothetical protein